MNQRNPIRMVVNGLNFGSIALDRLVKFPHNQYISVVGICDFDTVKAEAKAAELSVPVYASLDAILEDPNVEAIGLFTGPAGRAELIRQIIRAGKDVLTTKPFELSADAAVKVLYEAKSLGRTVIMNSPSPQMAADLDLVNSWQDEFDLGRPVAARFDVTGSYNEVADGSWYDDPIRCPVAPIFRLGIYLINDAVMLFGEAQEVRTVYSRIRTGRPTPDNAQLSILFKNGAIASIFASFCVLDGDAYTNQTTLNYERGTIFRNAGPIRLEHAEPGTEMQLVRQGENGREIAASKVLACYDPHFNYQTDYFYDAVRGIAVKEPTAPETVAAGIRIVEAMIVAQESDGSATVQPLTR
jgi:predicted dehydrogenase